MPCWTMILLLKSEAYVNGNNALEPQQFSTMIILIMLIASFQAVYLAYSTWEKGFY